MIDKHPELPPTGTSVEANRWRDWTRALLRMGGSAIESSASKDKSRKRPKQPNAVVMSSGRARIRIPDLDTVPPTPED